MNEEPTIRDVLDAMQTFSSSVDERFTGLEKDVAGLKTDVTGLKTDVTGLKTDVAGLKTDVAGLKTNVATIKATMVTKEYLDDKLSDLRGDLVALVRKGDRKLAAVVDELVKRQVFDEDTARRIFELEPFAR
jgi:polyhydroxyalkanoate synthesis regulator phasin